MLTGIFSAIGINLIMIGAFIIYDTIMDRTKK
jgi:hypothetical protein